jgi:hypothetical protein
MVNIFVTSEPHDIWYTNATRPFLSLAHFLYVLCKNHIACNDDIYQSKMWFADWMWATDNWLLQLYRDQVFFSHRGVRCRLVKAVDFNPLACYHCKFEYCWILWILSCEEASLLNVYLGSFLCQPFCSDGHSWVSSTNEAGKSPYDLYCTGATHNICHQMANLTLFFM